MLKIKELSSLLLIEDLGTMYPTKFSKKKERFCLYKCKCGSIFKARTADVNRGRTKSCGCKKTITHGMCSHRIFNVLSNMIQRCNNSNHDRFKDYGGRGISIYDRWLDVTMFIDDMYPSFEEGLTLDRIDVNGNYEPSNCRWATLTVQNRNNRKLRTSNTSGYRGVWLDRKTKKWAVGIRINTKAKKIGSFDTALEAAKAYDNFVIQNNLEHTINGVT